MTTHSKNPVRRPGLRCSLSTRSALPPQHFSPMSCKPLVRHSDSDAVEEAFRSETLSVPSDRHDDQADALGINGRLLTHRSLPVCSCARAR
jgi:hypothetical protein